MITLSLLTLCVSYQFTHHVPTLHAPQDFTILTLSSHHFVLKFVIYPSHASPRTPHASQYLINFFYALANRRRCHVTAPRTRLRRPPNAHSAFVALVGHVLLRPPLPCSLQTPCNAIITTIMMNHDMVSMYHTTSCV